MRKDGLFTRGARHSAEMRAKIKAAVENHWRTTRKRSAAAVAADEKRREIDAWVKEELAALREKKP